MIEAAYRLPNTFTQIHLLLLYFLLLQLQVAVCGVYLPWFVTVVPSCLYQPKTHFSLWPIWKYNHIDNNNTGVTIIVLILLFGWNGLVKNCKLLHPFLKFTLKEELWAVSASRWDGRSLGRATGHTHTPFTHRFHTFTSGAWSNSPSVTVENIVHNDISTLQENPSTG